MFSLGDAQGLTVGIAQISPVWLNRDKTLDKVIEPVVGKEKLIVAALDYKPILMERQNFDSVGHYARPDVTRLTVNRQRQNTLKFVD